MQHDDNIAARIIGGAYDDSIEDMVHAINERRRILRHVKAATMKAHLRVGDHVEFHSLSGGLNGYTGRVSAVKRTRCVVEPVTPTSMFSAPVSVPLSCVRLAQHDVEA